MFKTHHSHNSLLNKINLLMIVNHSNNWKATIILEVLIFKFKVHKYISRYNHRYLQKCLIIPNFHFNLLTRTIFRSELHHVVQQERWTQFFSLVCFKFRYKTKILCKKDPLKHALLNHCHVCVVICMRSRLNLLFLSHNE